MGTGGVSYAGSRDIDDSFTFYIVTHNASTGAAAYPSSAPTYRVYEDEGASPILTGSMADLNSTSTTGFYSETITLSAANGFERGKNYCVYIEYVVSSVTMVQAIVFQIGAAVDVVSIDKQATDGNNATLNLKKLNIVNSAGDALVATSTGSNGKGAIFTGHGSGSGLRVDGGDTAHGMYVLGGATSGNGLRIWSQGTDTEGVYFRGVGSAAGMLIKGGATGNGLYTEGGSTSGAGIYCVAAAGNSHGFYIAGSGSGRGIYANGGSSGDGIHAVGGASGGTGLKVEASANGYQGFFARGFGSGAGIYAKGGSTGHGINCEGGASGGNGLYADALASGTDGAKFEGAGTGAGLKAKGGSSGAGAHFDGGSGSGVGGKFTANGSGYQGVYIEGAGSAAGAYVKGGATGNGLHVAGGASSGTAFYCENLSASGATIFGVIAQAGMNAIADSVWRRTAANVEASSWGDSVAFRGAYGVMAKAVNKWSITSAVLTVFKADDSTSLGTQDVTTDASAVPIKALDTV